MNRSNNSITRLTALSSFFSQIPANKQIYVYFKIKIKGGSTGGVCNIIQRISKGSGSARMMDVEMMSVKRCKRVCDYESGCPLEIRILGRVEATVHLSHLLSYTSPLYRHLHREPRAHGVRRLVIVDGQNDPGLSNLFHSLK